MLDLCRQLIAKINIPYHDKHYNTFGCIYCPDKKNDVTICVIGGVRLSHKTKNSNKIIFWIVSIFVVGVIIFMVIDHKTEDVNNDATTIDLANQPVLGNEDAKVQIIEFGDYKCPACKSFGENFFPLIQKDFVDTGEVSFYFMNYDFINEDSTRAAEFAETVYLELGNDTFWKFHELMYANQPEDEYLNYFTEDKLLALLSEIANEEEVEQVKIAFESGEGKEPLALDNEYVEQLQLITTPSVFINGEPFTEGVYEDFKKQVNEALDSE